MKIFRFLLSAAAAATLFSSCNDGEKSPEQQNTAAEEKTTPQFKTATETYSSGNDTLVGFTVYDSSIREKRPAILVVHEWWGLNDYARSRAQQLAELGYVAMAVDMFGNGRNTTDKNQAGAMAGPFYSNPQMAKAKLDAALAKLKMHPLADTSKIAAIGYCFGGSMVLGYANMGADLDGVVSFHGALQGLKADKNLKAQVLICHGIDDSFVSDQDSAGYRKQLEDAGARYEFKSYPGAKHAFTNPAATETGRKQGIDVAYNAEADKASWNDMKNFLERIFK